MATLLALAGACGSDETGRKAVPPALVSDTEDAAQESAPTVGIADGTDPAGSPPPSAPTSLAPVTDPEPPSSVPSSPASTAPEPELATTTTTPELVSTGWTPLDPEHVSPKAFPPCCADNWHGAVSPPFGPAGQPLADGPYAVVAQWPDVPAEALELEVLRFDRCALLPMSSCDSSGNGVEFGPDELGIDGSESRTLTVPLDGTVRAVVVGWTTEEPVDPSGQSSQFVVEEATGAELAALAAEIEWAYAEVFGARLEAGEDPDTIVSDVLASPIGGFGPGLGSIGAVAFTPADGPPLLFQQVFPYIDGQRTGGRGTDVLSIRSLEVIDGRITLYVYGAYYP